MKFLGEKPSRLGIVSTLYSQYTATHLTEALMNTFTRSNKKADSFQSQNSFLVEWDIAVNRIKRVPILSAEGTGENGADVVFHFPENYYQKNDVFVVERTRQQFFVTNRPQRLRDNDWVVIAKIQDSDYDAKVDMTGIYAGSTTRFLTNFVPELHEEGYSRYQSNTEKHRTYISTHRCDVDMSAQYIPMEEVFIQIGKGDKDDPVYKMEGAEKVCLDSFMEARGNALLWAKTNVDKHGKPKTYDELGRPIIAGDGIIPQIERFATKFVFSRLSVPFFQKVMQAMIAKCESAVGNHFVVICNTPYWHEVQTVLGAWLKDFHTDGTYVYSKASNGYVDMGATYQSYEWAGNTISFKIDRCLDVEFPTRKYGLIIDLTADAATGKPALQFLTFKGGDLIHNWINGVGGKSGLSSGEVSSPVAGVKLVNWGYAGVAVYNPYRSVIMISEEIKNAWF